MGLKHSQLGEPLLLDSNQLYPQQLFSSFGLVLLRILLVLRLQLRPMLLLRLGRQLQRLHQFEFMLPRQELAIPLQLVEEVELFLLLWPLVLAFLVLAF